MSSSRRTLRNQHAPPHNFGATLAQHAGKALRQKRDAAIVLKGTDVDDIEVDVCSGLLSRRELPRLICKKKSSSLLSMGAWARVAIACAAMAVVIAEACTPSCPEFQSPCAKPFDVGQWCGGTQCQLDGGPAECGAFSGCRVARGKTLSVPISAFEASLTVHDLKIELSDGCSGGSGPKPQDLLITIDGVAGTATASDATTAIVTWSPFPSTPTLLEVSYSNPTAAPCLNVELSFVDERCETQNPAPVCPS
jgi:hypothetical protein